MYFCSFPDGTVENAENFCRSPREGMVPYCWADDYTPAKCDIPRCGTSAILILFVIYLRKISNMSHFFHMVFNNPLYGAQVSLVL